MSASIIAENLVKTYGTNNEVRALDGLSLTVKEGTVLSLLGPNGSGKTTTVRVLSTLLRPDSGRATVAGIDVLKNPQQVRSSR
jgi:ABC-2 type transport system ATP-binding protein